jgi:hypothetical protein
MRNRNERPVVAPPAARQPNALKHGVFCAADVLPGEDAREFEDLVDAVFAEYEPSGPVEEDAARSIASAIWRKQRLSIFLRAQRASALLDGFLEGRPNDNRKEYFALVLTLTDAMSSAKSRDEIFKYNDMLEKVFQELDIKRRRTSKAANMAFDSQMDEAWVDVELAVLGEAISPEQYVKRLELEQRLDAKIDRAVKRLLQLKAMKSVVGIAPQQRALPRAETPKAN